MYVRRWHEFLRDFFSHFFGDFWGAAEKSEYQSSLEKKKKNLSPSNFFHNSRFFSRLTDIALVFLGLGKKKKKKKSI